MKVFLICVYVCFIFNCKRVINKNNLQKNVIMFFEINDVSAFNDINQFEWEEKLSENLVLIQLSLFAIDFHDCQ